MHLNKVYFVIAFICVSVIATAQQPVYKFSFGTGKTADGYIPVTPGTKFNYKTGYGFSQGSIVKQVTGKNNIGFVTGDRPFYFSVMLPDGNYDVKLSLGDKESNSATTVRAENRRLFLSNFKTKKGELKTVVFTVHIRDSLIRDADKNVIGKVKLKPREINYLHWDNMLTLEFSDSLPKLCSVEITPNKKAATVFLAGNSTVVDQDKDPWAAWGQMFPSFFESGNVCIANYAESGETLKAFKGEKRLEKLLRLSKPGDYLFIEFAHNDQKPGSSYLDPFTTYKSTLKEWIGEARNRQLVPVLVTSMHRRNFDTAGHIINTLSDYPAAMRQTAAEENVALIDLNAMSKTLYEAWGAERSLKAFVHFPAHSFPGQDSALKDNTHFTTYGAYELARCVIEGLKKTTLDLTRYIKKEIPRFDPASPDPWQLWYWPLSPVVASVKPDGN
jgi:lysophospholipase L1-like esterase